MAIFTAIATAIAGALGGGLFAAAVGYFAAGALALGATRLIAKRMLKGMNAGGDGGGRVQLPPATDNKIPVVYGSAFLGGPVIDAYLTPDQKTMYYVIALAEKTDNGTITFGNIYYDGKLVTLAGTSVTSLTTNTTPAQIDPRVNGKINMWFYDNGSNSPTNSFSNAYDIFPGWGGDPNYAMTNCAFVVVQVNYNTDAGTTNLGALTVEVINTESGESTGVYRPGTAIYDYMTNTRYGCAIPANKVEDVTVPGTSLYELNAYSDELIEYIPANGDTTPPLPTQARYRINGPLDTAENCLDNLQRLVDSCDSWLQYSELTGEWKVVINKPYTTTMYEVDSSNLVGGILISPLDLNDTYNQLEVAYPNNNIKDQTDYQVILLQDYQPGVMSPNEATNRLNMGLPLVNNAVQAKYLGIRRLLQSREDLVITFMLDFSGIQLEAGDVIKVTHEVYGWTEKEFRVSQVIEEKTTEGSLQARIEAFEYNATIYDDQALQDFIPAFNTGLKDPNVITAPGQPTANTNPDTSGAVSSFVVTGAVPEQGSVIYMDFNYGNNSNVQTHILYRTVSPAVGTAFTNSTDIANNIGITNVSVDINDLPANNYYFSITARNDFAGQVSPVSNLFAWNGTEITNPVITLAGNANSIGNQITCDPVPNITVGSNVFFISGTGLLEPNTYVTTITSNGSPTIFNVTPTPNIALLNATIEIVGGGAIGNVIRPNTLPGNTVISNSLPGNRITGNTVTANQIAANTIIANNIAANAIVAGKIDANAITAGTIAANAVTANTIAANAVTAGTIAANAVTANTIAANAVTAGTIAANAVTANTIAANAVTAGTISANAVTAGTISANAVIAGTIAANAVTANTIAANAVTAGTIAANAVTANTIAANAVTAGTVAANVITTTQLVIGSVTQAKSSIQEAQVQPMPFTNIGNAWPDNTRVIVPAGGVTIIPTTDPNSSANTAYQEGSRIQVGFTVKLFANTTSNNHFYNLIELWKSGASDNFDQGLNTVRKSYEDNTYGRTQTIHAYGFGQLDLFTSDQGQTWANYSNVQAGNAIMTGAMNLATSANANGIITYNIGPLQDVDNNGSTFCAGQRTGNIGSGSKLDLDENLPFLATTTLKLDMNGLEYAPGTGIDAGAGANRELLGVADNGTVFWSPTGSFSTTAQTTEGVSGLYKNLYGIFANPANGSSYTAVAVGQTGTVLRASRTFNTSATWSSKNTTIIGNTELLTDLYDVAGDNTTQSSTSKWVAVGQYGMIQVSIDDGDSWTQITSPTLTDLNGIRYGNNVWVVVGDGGTILKNSGNIELANDWIQVDTSNINWANGTNYGNIQGRDLRTIDFSETYNKFFIGGTGMIVRAEANTTITPEVSYEVGPSESYDLTRMSYFGSWPNVAQTTLPPEEQRVVNNQVFSYTIIDTDYVQGQETTYYLVVGNMAGATVYVGQAYLNVQEIKR